MNKTNSWLVTFRQYLAKRHEQAKHYIEYKRLKRIRKFQTPQYTNCKNCGEKLQGMYCYKCGQYALDVNQNIWAYLRQFAENAYQFDGKIMQTIRFLLVKPGFLSVEFVKGKINSYVHPMRLYMFMSMVFFSFVLLLFSNVNIYDKFEESRKQVKINAIDAPNRAATADSVMQVVAMANTDNPYHKEISDAFLDFGVVLENDTIQTAQTNRDEMRRRTNMVYKEAFAQISKYTPFILLLLIPVYSGMLYLCYRKSCPYYMHHIVFSFHVHTFFLFLVSLNVLLLYYTSWSYCLLISMALFVLYHMLASRSFYRQNWWETIFRTTINMVLYGFLLMMVTSIATLILGVRIFNEFKAGLL